jgi:radical SAM superfamily enzyme YgiQ (UPF0313 family)
VDKEPWVPLGALSIASLFDGRMDVACSVYLKRDYTPSVVKKYIERAAPDIIGLTCFTYNRFSCLELAAMAKKAFPNILVVFGGPHATFMDRQMLEAYSFIDLIVRGEGEMTFSEVVDCWFQGKDLKRVAGVSYRQQGKIERNIDRPRLGTLNDLPLIDYKKWDICVPYQGDWGFSIHRNLPIETSRGCPARCFFCITPQMWGKKVSFRDVERVIEQIKLVPREWRGRLVFPDMNFSVHREYVRNLCRAIVKNNLKIKWACQTRIDLVDRETLVWMKEAGCLAVTYGVESLSDRILKAIPKPFSAAQAVRISNLTAQLGIHSRMNLIIGFPLENAETIKETVRHLMKLDARVGGTLDYLMIMPGTSLYSRALQEGFNEDYWLEDHEVAIPYYPAVMSVAELHKWAGFIRRSWKGYQWEQVLH